MTEIGNYTILSCPLTINKKNVLQENGDMVLVVDEL